MNLLCYLSNNITILSLSFGNDNDDDNQSNKTYKILQMEQEYVILKQINKNSNIATNDIYKDKNDIRYKNTKDNIDNTITIAIRTVITVVSRMIASLL